MAVLYRAQLKAAKYTSLSSGSVASAAWYYVNNYENSIFEILSELCCNVWVRVKSCNVWFKVYNVLYCIV